MYAVGKSDIGKIRDTNQDAYYVSTEEDPFKLYILADGMGGYNGGDIASKLAVAAIYKFFQSNFEKTEKNKESLQKLIRDAIEYANMIVYERSKEEPELYGMGTTIEVCLILGERAYIGHIGDSRIYRIRNNTIRKLTRDDSYVEKLIKEGKLTREEAETHPKKHMLMKALGCEIFVEPVVSVKGFVANDMILMCSDGLTNMVPESDILNTILRDSDKAADQLIYEANSHGGVDNITVILIK